MIDLFQNLASGFGCDRTDAPINDRGWRLPRDLGRRDAWFVAIDGCGLGCPLYLHHVAYAGYRIVDGDLFGGGLRGFDHRRDDKHAGDAGRNRYCVRRLSHDTGRTCRPRTGNLFGRIDGRRLDWYRHSRSLLPPSRTDRFIFPSSGILCAGSVWVDQRG